MMISFIPQRNDETLTVTRTGDVLTVNGETLDLSAIPEGATLPGNAVASDWVAGPITREGGELALTLILPHGPNAPEETRFPAPLEITGNGPVELPLHNIAEPDGDHADD